MQPRWLSSDRGGVLELLVLLLLLLVVLLLPPQRRQLLALALPHRRYPLPHLLARRHLRNRERRRLSATISLVS